MKMDLTMVEGWEAAVEAARPKTPADELAVIAVHPDRYEEMRARFPAGEIAPDPLAGMFAIEIITSSLISKARGLLMDRDRQVIGIITIDDGWRCYFFKGPEESWPKFKVPSDFWELREERR